MSTRIRGPRSTTTRPPFRASAMSTSSQNDMLLASYLTGEVELTQQWTVRSGLGYAERVPDLVNRYADGVFLGILQNGFSKVVGFPASKKSGPRRPTSGHRQLWLDHRPGRGVLQLDQQLQHLHLVRRRSTDRGSDPPRPEHGAGHARRLRAVWRLSSNDITTFFASMQYVQAPTK